MTDSQWTKQDATLSHKNACKEFGLKEDEIIGAMKDGKLQYRLNYAHVIGDVVDKVYKLFSA